MSNDRVAKILVVEDEGITGLQLEQTLTKAGYEVPAVAASAEEALEAIEGSAPDLVLMDIHIQGATDGVETAREIRRKFQLPVIFVTAHADSLTLERARDTEPFGYIVKPISMLSLLSSIEIALHKHKIERRLADHRAWLSSVVQSIPEAVIVTDVHGNVEFLNDVGEELTGRENSRVLGQDIRSVLELTRGVNGDVTSDLLRAAMRQRELVQIPRETYLRCPKTGVSIPIEGEVAVSYAGQQIAGTIFSLRDASLREQEDKQARQEQKMMVVGQLASDIASDFNGLLSVISDCSDQIEQAIEQTADQTTITNLSLIRHASAMSMLMSQQLLKLGKEQHLRPAVVSVNNVISGAIPVLRVLCGKSLPIELVLSCEPTSVLCHPNHLEQVLLNVILNIKQRLIGSGKVRIVTDVVHGAREQVRISFQLASSGPEEPMALGFPFEMDSPDLSLSVASAIITAAEGVMRFVKTSESSGEVEILLPQEQVSIQPGEALTARRGTVLLVGADDSSEGLLRRELERKSYVVISSAGMSEAMLVAQLHGGRVDVVVADRDSVSQRECARLAKHFTSLNAQTKFIYLGCDEPRRNSSWALIVKPVRGRDVIETVNAILSNVRSQTRTVHA